MNDLNATKKSSPVWCLNSPVLFGLSETLSLGMAPAPRVTDPSIY